MLSWAISLLLTVMLCFLGCSLQASEVSKTSTEAAGLKSDNPLNFISINDVTETRFVGSVANRKLILRLRLTNSAQLKFKRSNPSEFQFQNQVYLMDGDDIYWGDRMSLKEIRELITRQLNSVKINKLDTFAKLLINKSYAADSEYCTQTRPIANEIKSLQAHTNSFAFGEFVKRCDFKIEDLVSDKIEELRQTFKTIQNASVSDFLKSVREGFSVLKDLIPDLNAKLIEPLIELAQKVPPLANKLVCGFVQEKIGDLFTSLALGPAALVRFSAKTAADIAEFASKVYKFTGNGTAAFFVVDLHRTGKLKSHHLDRMMKLENDLPPEMKRKISNRFHGFTTHGNMRVHIDKHRREMGFRSEEAYLEAAHKFSKHVDRDNLVFVHSDGRIKKWNTKTDEYVVLSPSGQIITYFKQTCKNHAEKLLVLLLSQDERKSEGVCESFDK